MTAERASTRAGDVSWRLAVAVLVILSAAAPFVFGLPVIGKQICMDGNFALEMTKGYLSALHGGVWFPHWLPGANAGMGSPAFYYYGRLPFLVAAALGLMLHLGPVEALIAGFVVFRLAAFLTCRMWLVGHCRPRAADLGALTFTALPFAMSFNPVTRVGFAETAATAFVPVVFLALDAVLRSRRGVAWATPLLAIVYAVIAFCHPLQVVLTFAVALLYVLVWRNKWGVLANCAGLALGLLLSAASWLPALSLQSMISAAAWTNNFYLDMWNQFFFTHIRFRLWGFYQMDIWLYATWLLCAATLVVCLRWKGVAWRDQDPRQLVLAICLGIVLLAMTGLSRPFWLAFHSLRIIQFPWRLLPCGVALAGALVSGWADVNRRKEWRVLSLVSVMVIGQLAVVGLGGYFSFSGFRSHHHIPDALLARVPAFVPRAQRALPTYAEKRNNVAEYIPVGARQAGWHLDSQTEQLVPSRSMASVPALPNGLHATILRDGNLAVSGILAKAGTVLLPEFYFPDEVASGGLSLPVSPDAGTGLARLQLPAGPIVFSLSHDGQLAPVREGHELSVLGVSLLFLWVLMAFFAERGVVLLGGATLRIKLGVSSGSAVNVG